MTVSEQELTKMIAVISMLIAFMKSDPEATDELVGNIESIAALTKAVLELTGKPPFLLSFSFLWQASTEALVEIEKEFFPDLPYETPTHLVTPNHFLPLSQVTLTSWSGNHRLIEPAFLAIQKFRKWFKEHYSMEIHDDVMSLCEDALLLIETMADMCNVVLHNTEPFEA